MKACVSASYASFKHFYQVDEDLVKLQQAAYKVEGVDEEVSTLY